jgi:hypothetical protein
VNIFAQEAPGKQETVERGNRKNGRENSGNTTTPKDEYSWNYQSFGNGNHGYGAECLDFLFKILEVPVSGSSYQKKGLYYTNIRSFSL